MNGVALRFILICIALVIVVTRYLVLPHDDAVLKKIAGKPATISGIITDDPFIQKGSAKFTLLVRKINGQEVKNSKVHNRDQKGKHKVLVRTDSTNFMYGDEVEVRATIRKPEIIESKDGRDFDYASYLLKDGIFYTTTVRGKDTKTGKENARILSRGHGNKIAAGLYNFKRVFVEHINRLLPSPHSFLASGLIISGKGSLDKKLQEDFQRAGLIHIVVLSGFNISIIGEAITRVFSFLPQAAGAICGGIGIILFSVMIGGGSTVVRSAIMALIGLYARISGRTSSALTSLVVAGLVMLIWNPALAIHDPSFQLSFAATLGLILYADPIERLIASLAKKVKVCIPQSLLSLVSSTLSTQIFTMPLILHMSGVVSLVALPVNIVVLPLIPITMFFVFVAGSASFMAPALAMFPAFVSYMLLSYELMVVSSSAALSFAAIKLPPVSLAAVLVSYFILLFVGRKLYIQSEHIGSAGIFTENFLKRGVESKSKNQPPKASTYISNTSFERSIQYEKAPP